MAWRQDVSAAWHLLEFAMALLTQRATISPELIQTMAGRNADGSFRIAIGIKYPDGLCGAIIEAMGLFAFSAETLAQAPTPQPNVFPFKVLVDSSIFLLKGSAEAFGADYLEGKKLQLLVVRLFQ